MSFPLLFSWFLHIHLIIEFDKNITMTKSRFAPTPPTVFLPTHARSSSEPHSFAHIFRSSSLNPQPPIQLSPPPNHSK